MSTRFTAWDCLQRNYKSVRHTKDCQRYTSYLPGLKYWHVYGDLSSYWQEQVKEWIGMLMDRNLEVTFDLTE